MAFTHEDFCINPHLQKMPDTPWKYKSKMDNLYDIAVDGYFDPIVSLLKEGQEIQVFQRMEDALMGTINSMYLHLWVTVERINTTVPFVITSIPSDNLKDKDDL